MTSHVSLLLLALGVGLALAGPKGNGGGRGKFFVSEDCQLCIDDSAPNLGETHAAESDGGPGMSNPCIRQSVQAMRQDCKDVCDNKGNSFGAAAGRAAQAACRKAGKHLQN